MVTEPQSLPGYQLESINKLGDRQFQLIWSQIVNGSSESKPFTMQLDFNPLVAKIGPARNYSLLHFQSQPFDGRQWGAYDLESDLYFTGKDEDFSISGKSILVKIPDNKKTKTKPTAVIMYPETSVQQQGKYIYIG